MDPNDAGVDSFELFVRQYSKPLYNYLKKLTGIGEDAEDLLQEVLIKIAERLPDLRDPAKIKTWAFRIATNTAIDFFRKRGKFDQVEFDESLLDGDAANSDIEDEAVVNEMNECIRGEMGRIAPLYHTTLVLYYFEHMAVPEIAKICDISVPAVKIRLHRGKRLLNRVLTEGCNFYFDKNSNMRCSSKSKQ